MYQQKEDDDFSISKKIKFREKYGNCTDFFKNPISRFEQNPKLAFIPGFLCASAVVLFFAAVFKNPFLFPPFFSIFLSLESAVLFTALAIFFLFIWFEEKHQKRIEIVEEKLPGFLHDISDLIAGGLTLQEALTEISGKNQNKKQNKIHDKTKNKIQNKSQNKIHDKSQKQKDFFENEIRLIGLKMKAGIPFDICLENFGKRYDSKLVQRAASVISAAEKSGGLMYLSIDAAVFDVREAVNLKKERDSKQSVYGTVLFISFLLFIGIAVLLIRQFDIMNSMTSQVDSSETAKESAALIYRMLLIQAFFSGLMIGKLRKGKTAAGLKYAFIIMFCVWISFTAGGVI